jgi:hypothetical protein
MDPTPLPHHPALARAIQRKDWERASLYVLVAALRIGDRLPHATLDDLLDALADDALTGTEDSDDPRARR